MGLPAYGRLDRGQPRRRAFTAGGATPLLSDYVLLPGVLYAYTANVDGYAAPVPEPQTWALMALGLAAVGGIVRSRRAA